MTQGTSLTSPRLLGALLALPLALFSWPAGAEDISSVYTPLELAHCEDVTPDEVKEYGSVLSCPGRDGIDVRVAEGDLRIFVSYGPKAETQIAAYATPSATSSNGGSSKKAGGRSRSPLFSASQMEVFSLSAASTADALCGKPHPRVSAFDPLPVEKVNLVYIDGGLVPGNAIGADAFC